MRCLLLYADALPKAFDDTGFCNPQSFGGIEAKADKSSHGKRDRGRGNRLLGLVRVIQVSCCLQ